MMGEDELTCPNCGTHFDEEGVDEVAECPDCGGEVGLDDTTCPHCGARFEE